MVEHNKEHDVEHDVHNIPEKIISYRTFGEADGKIGKQMYDLQTGTVEHLFRVLSSPGYRYDIIFPCFELTRSSNSSTTILNKLAT